MNFQEILKLKQDMVNSHLEELLKIEDAPGDILDAMKYSLLACGKRIRPILAISICEALGGRIEDVLSFACAMEMIHTYSLIHDDLPAMDNDNLRRGKPTNHVVFGEAKAILAGDALLNYAFEVMLSEIAKKGYGEKYVKAAEIVAASSGVKGMIGGQVIDIESENSSMDLKELQDMHRRKTGALIEASALLGCIISGKTERMDLVGEYSRNLGIAFQIVDDILDYEGDSSILGKSIGKDEAEGKSTFVSILGIEKSKEMANKYSENAYDIAKSLDASGFLGELTLYLLNRKN